MANKPRAARGPTSCPRVVAVRRCCPSAAPSGNATPHMYPVSGSLFCLSKFGATTTVCSVDNVLVSDFRGTPSLTPGRINGGNISRFSLSNQGFVVCDCAGAISNASPRT